MGKWKEFKIKLILFLIRRSSDEEDRSFLIKYIEMKLGLITQSQFEFWVETKALEEFPKEEKSLLGLE